MTSDDTGFLREAIALSLDASTGDEGGPFGAVVVGDGRVVGRGRNRVLALGDPTAHAEVLAIREAAGTLGTHDLSGCVLYASCEPCPMCLGATYWSRIDRIVYGNRRQDAAAIGFDDAFFYDELLRPVAERRLPATRLLGDEAAEAFRRWFAREDRRLY